MSRAALGRSAVGLAVVGVAFAWALPRFASYGDVVRQLGTLGPAATLLLAVVGLANILSPATSQCAATPGLRFPHAVASDWTTSAITNTIPGGSALAIAVTWAMYRSFGIARRDVARCVVVTGVWDAFVKLGTPLVAVLWLSTERPVGRGLLQAALLGVVLFAVVLVLGAVVLAGPSTADRVGRWLDRLPRLGSEWPRRLRQLRDDTSWLLRTRWRRLTWWTVAGHANLYLLLLVCLRALGAGADELSAAAVLAAFAFGRLVTTLPVSPGGLGVMEVGLTGALAAVGRAEPAAVVAAVLLFRFATYAIPIPLGAACWLWWNTWSRSRSQPVPVGASSER